MSKFNSKTINWNIDICALGGVNYETLRKIKLTKSVAIGFKKLISRRKIKKPAYNLM